MKFFILLALMLPIFAQSPPALTALSLATRMSQLMESTAVAVPELVHASEPVRQLAGSTLAGIRATPQDSALTYRFINEVRAYLTLSDSFPAPDLPAAASQQFGELREDLIRFQQRFEADLASQRQAMTALNADPDNLRRYAEANTKLLPLGAVPRVVFLGDSITDGWHLNEYFTGRDFVNRGISGQTSGQMLGRFMQDVVSAHPRAVIILAGTNDIARGIPPSAIEDTLSMMGDIAKVHGIKVIVASILPVSDYHSGEDPQFNRTKTRPPEVIRQVNLWIKDYCQKQQFVFLDYFTALADGKGQLPADLADDGLHPNSKGYRVMSPVALEAINRALAAIAPPPAETQSRRRFGLSAPTRKSDNATP